MNKKEILEILKDFNSLVKDDLKSNPKYTWKQLKKVLHTLHVSHKIWRYVNS